MKNIILLSSLLILSINAFCLDTLKIGSNGYVTINNVNYERGFVGSSYSRQGSDTLLQILINSGQPRTLIYSQKANSYADGNNNVAFTSMQSLISWMNTNFEPLNSGVGSCVHVFKTPPITAGTAYVSGYVVGGIDTFVNAFRIINGSGILASTLLIDRANQKAPMTLLLYDYPPSHGTYTDHIAFTFDSTDSQHFIRGINFTNTDYTTDGLYAWIDYGSIAKIIESSDGTANLYGILVTTGNPTFNSTKNLTIKLGIIQN